MVANLEQYIFLHDSLLEAVLCGETGVTSNELSRHYDQLITGESINHPRDHSRDQWNLMNFVVSNGNAPIQEEFETLTVLTPRLTTEECQTARLARNRPKNRFMDVFPADRKFEEFCTATFFTNWPMASSTGTQTTFLFQKLTYAFRKHLREFLFIVWLVQEGLVPLLDVFALFNSWNLSNQPMFLGMSHTMSTSLKHIFSSVLQLRAVRPQLVETLDQYRFIYEVAMEYADSQNLWWRHRCYVIATKLRNTSMLYNVLYILWTIST